MCRFCDDYNEPRRKAIDKRGWNDDDPTPHKKASKSKGRKRSDHKHIIEQERVERVPSAYRPGIYYTITYYNCIICMDRPSRKYEWSAKT